MSRDANARSSTPADPRQSPKPGRQFRTNSCRPAALSLRTISTFRYRDLPRFVAPTDAFFFPERAFLIGLPVSTPLPLFFVSLANDFAGFEAAISSALAPAIPPPAAPTAAPRGPASEPAAAPAAAPPAIFRPDMAPPF